LLDVAPDFVVTVRDLGNKFGQVARHFGTLETLERGANGQAIKTVTGVHFVVDQIELDYAFKDYSIQEVAVPGLAVMVDNTRPPSRSASTRCRCRTARSCASRSTRW
jgi:hypothetical protein